MIPPSALQRLIHKIDEAVIDPAPSDNIYMEELFNPIVYDGILQRLPLTNAYDFIIHPDANLPDGTITRKLLSVGSETMERFVPENRLFWQQLSEILTSEALVEAIVKKFHRKIKSRFSGTLPPMVMVPVLYRDFPGYRIGVHPDAEFKIATLQFYLPKDYSQIHLGTSFHRREGDRFHLWKTNLFKPNSAYAFARTDDSYHSVKEIGPHELERDTLALTLYIKGNEYRSSRYYDQ